MSVNEEFLGFNRSSKWKSILKVYYEFSDMDHQEGVKYISTRWLFTGKSINLEMNR